MTIGERIKSYREKNGFTQAELGKRIGVSGVAIMRYEKGLREPKMEILHRISDALGVSISDLLGVTESVIIPGRLKVVSFDSPDGNNVVFRIEAEDEEAYKVGLQIFENSGVKIDDLTVNGRIRVALEKLNDAGQFVAVERVEELTKIPDYQRKDEKPEEE